MFRLTVTLQAAATAIKRTVPRLFFVAALAWPVLGSGAGTNIYCLGRSTPPTNNPLIISRSTPTDATWLLGLTNSLG